MHLGFGNTAINALRMDYIIRKNCGMNSESTVRYKHSDYLNEIEEARHELALYEDKAISIITRMDVLIGTNDLTDKKTRIWLQNVFTAVPLDEQISDNTIEIRKTNKIKLPDAIIYATAQVTAR